LRKGFWFFRRKKYARIEFMAGGPARILRGVKKLIHKNGFVELTTRHEIFLWRESEVRMIHVYSYWQKPEIKKEAPF